MKFGLLAMVMIAFAACQKTDRPALGNYPKDTNPPGGPLKFYATFEAEKSGFVFDSIKANFGQPNSASIVDGGVTGKAFQGTNNGFIVFPSANDFAQSTSFTVSF